jgi:hypothetical protein
MMMFQAFRQRLLGVGMLLAVSTPISLVVPNVHGFSSLVVVLPAKTPTKEMTTDWARHHVGRTGNSAGSLDCSSTGNNHRCGSSFLMAARDGTTGITATTESTDTLVSASDLEDSPTTLRKGCHPDWSSHLSSMSFSEPKSRRKSLAVVLGYCSSILVNSAVVMNRAHATTDDDQRNIRSQH